MEAAGSVSTITPHLGLWCSQLKSASIAFGFYARHPFWFKYGFRFVAPSKSVD